MAESFVVMLRMTGEDDDSRWFEYRPTFFGDIVRVEWDKGTMNAAFPTEAAGWLLRNGYAREMTEAEVDAYTTPIDIPALPVGKKGD
jgi:hypothetical protein